jgi:hypothetical protein
MIDAAKQHELAHWIAEGEETKAGQQLLVTCLESVAYRYPHVPHDNDAGLPGHDDRPATYGYKTTGCTFTKAQASCLFACYAYQSCEHPSWETSWAKALCEAVADKVGEFQGSIADECTGFPWGFTDQDRCERVKP